MQAIPIAQSTADTPERRAFYERIGRQNLTPHLLEKRVIVPGRIGHDVMQRLMHLAHLAGGKPRSHRLHTFPFPFQQQTRTVAPQRNLAVSMPHGLRQPVHICREAFLLCCWRRTLPSH